jgi:O-acetyl-ADP-ribose deacetylase
VDGKMDIKVNEKLISIEVGDITGISVDAIVNAANSSLLGGGGVDGAIHRAAGSRLLDACRLLDGCPTGEARITKAYNLPSEWVIHTVGPVYSDGYSGEAELLASAYRSSLTLADEYGIKTIAFPAISTGVYGYPMDKASEISLVTVRDYLKGSSNIFSVKIILFSQSYYNTYEDVILRLFPG